MSYQEESQLTGADYGEVVHVTPAAGLPEVVVVCEHASNRVPAALADLGVDACVLESHVAWDPGALPVAQHLAAALDAPLVSGGISRLVYDCNRPPEAPSAIPARSEVHDIPGNRDLSAEARQLRVSAVYEPFRRTLAEVIASNAQTLRLMVTVHSFTPVFHGAPRAVELGVLHGSDTRFARAMMASAAPDAAYVIRLNEPYSAADGVAHTLDLQGSANGLLNVMIEVRNDLIRTEDQQATIAAFLADWIARTRTALAEEGVAA